MAFQLPTRLSPSYGRNAMAYFIPDEDRPAQQPQRRVSVDSENVFEPRAPYKLRYGPWIGACMLLTFLLAAAIALLIANFYASPLIPDFDPCANDPCMNGGTCEADDDNENFTCTCAMWYSGDRCQIGTTTAGPSTEETTTVGVPVTPDLIGCSNFQVAGYDNEPTNIPLGWEVYYPYEVYGGMPVYNIMNGDACIVQCLAVSDCCAVDYNMQHEICYLHIPETQSCCDTIEWNPEENTVHMKKDMCDATTVEPTCTQTVTGTVAPEVTTATTEMSTTETTVTTEETTITEAFTTTITTPEETTPEETTTTEAATTIMTTTTTTTEAVTTVAMTTRLFLENCDTFSVDDYSNGPSPDDIPGGWHVYYPGRVYGGEPQTGSSFPEADDCIDACLAERPDCQGLDYDMDTEMCYLHLTATESICNAIETGSSVNEFIHLKVDACSGDYPEPTCTATVETTTAPATTAAAVVTTAAATAAATTVTGIPDCANSNNNLSGDPDEPSNIPTNYLVYWPGFVSGGTRADIASGQNGDACITQCLLTSGCISFSYDMVNLECYLHFSDTGCDTIDQSDDTWIHIKRNTASCTGQTVSPNCIGNQIQ